MKRLHIYDNEIYDDVDRGGFIYNDRTYRPREWTMYANTITGVATIDYTVEALMATPVDVEDWTAMSGDTITGSFVYRLPDGFAATWINECIVEDLISQHVMGTLDNPIKDRERDIMYVMLPRIGAIHIVGTKRSYAIDEINYPATLQGAELYGTLGNVLIDQHDFWTNNKVEVVEDHGHPNCMWLVERISSPNPRDRHEEPVEMA